MTKEMKVLGVGGINTQAKGSFLQDDFLPELRGRSAIRKYREMADNDPTVGASLHAMKQILRSVKITPKSRDKNNPECNRAAQFVSEVLGDMDHSFEDFLAESLSFLEYGFSWFEIVAKRRNGLSASKKSRSKYSDGMVGIKKIASRAQWTIESFDLDDDGDLLGAIQSGVVGRGTVYLPSDKSLHFRTTTLNGDPAGRSVLRNSYLPYLYVQNIQRVEAVGVERELTGMPVGRIPAEYLAEDATEEQRQVRNHFEKILRDIKMNDQGYILVPSDVYMDDEGKSSGVRMMDIELMASQGTRLFDTNPIISRYKGDIAQTLLADFIQLGSTGSGSFALSQSKITNFLMALRGYVSLIRGVLESQLIPFLWRVNGLPDYTMPTLEASDIVPPDLREMSSFLRNLNIAGIEIAEHPEIVRALMELAGLPFDAETYKKPSQSVPEPDSAEVELTKSLSEWLNGQANTSGDDQVRTGTPEKG